MSPKLILGTIVLMVGTVFAGYLYAQYRDNRFRPVPGYSWAIDGRTGQLCSPWPKPYETAIKDEGGIPYCSTLK